LRPASLPNLARPLQRLTAAQRRRIDEIAAVVRDHASHSRTDVSVAQVDTWRTQIDTAEAAGEFFFAEPRSSP